MLLFHSKVRLGREVAYFLFHIFLLTSNFNLKLILFLKIKMYYFLGVRVEISVCLVWQLKLMFDTYCPLN